MPAPVEITRSADIETNTGQTEGMIRKGAIVDRSSICASTNLVIRKLSSMPVMIAKPHSASAIHHHGGQDTIVYSRRGTGAVVSEGGTKKQILQPGDFALIPTYAEHQEVNEGDEEVEWIITRSGRIPDVVNLHQWGSSSHA